MSKSFLIIGIGRFGKHLAEKLVELGNEVVVVDKDEEKMENLNMTFTDSFIGDCRNMGVLRSLGIDNFDICFVCISLDFQASLEITSMLSELGAQKIVSVAKRDRQKNLLLKIGADEVIYAEREIAEKSAIKYNAKNILDLIQITDEYAIYEVPVFSSWIDKSIGDINVRKHYHVNIIAIKQGEKILAAPGADYHFCEGDQIMILGSGEDVYRLTERT